MNAVLKGYLLIRSSHCNTHYFISYTHLMQLTWHRGILTLVRTQTNDIRKMCLEIKQIHFTICNIVVIFATSKVSQVFIWSISQRALLYWNTSHCHKFCTWALKTNRVEHWQCPETLIYFVSLNELCYYYRMLIEACFESIQHTHRVVPPTLT